MSTKFEQLLDYLVNEEMDKANDLFHEIVVEKSREIYENLISEEIEEESTVDEEVEETDEAVEESDGEEDLEEMSELDDSMYDEASSDDDMDMDADPDAMGGDATDDLLGDVESDGEADEDQAMMDIKNAIEELEAAFAELEAAQDSEEGDEFGDEEDGEEFGDEEDDEEDEENQMEETMGLTMENRRMTREYVEKVGNDWEKSGSMKSQGQYVGAGTGEKDGAPQEGKSAVASGANKPGPGGVNAKNLNQGATEGQKNTGTTPNKVNKGIVPDSGEKFASGIHNVDNKKSGVKTLTNVKGGHGAEKKGAAPGPVGSGSGDKAGQTSVSSVKQFLKPYSK